MLCANAKIEAMQFKQILHLNFSIINPIAWNICVIISNTITIKHFNYTIQKIDFK